MDNRVVIDWRNRGLDRAGENNWGKIGTTEIEQLKKKEMIIIYENILVTMVWSK